MVTARRVSSLADWALGGRSCVKSLAHSRSRAPAYLPGEETRPSSSITPSLESVEQRLGLEQVDAAFDEVDDRLDLGLLLDLLLDEPLEELVSSVIARLDGGRRHPIEQDRHVPLGLEVALGGRQRRCESRGGRLQRPQIELDLVVGQEIQGLLGGLGLVARLLLEELAPAPEAGSVEIDRDGRVELMGAEFTADLGDEQLAAVATDHVHPPESRVRGLPDRR